MWSSSKSKGAESAAGEDDLQDTEVKVVLVGDSQCGKTALVQRFILDHFTENYVPTGFEKYSAVCPVADYRVDYSIWDTSGAIAYDTVRPLAYQDARVFMLCFNVAEPESLHNATAKWYPEILGHLSGGTPVILCGCRTDLRHDPDVVTHLTKLQEQPVTSEQALAVARQLGATTYVETSAKTASKAVRDAFEVAALAALGKLNKQASTIVCKQKPVGRSKSKRDLKAELKGRAKSCCVM